jgi:two-component system, cell cycle sensor histidine kinase and response regulator CckA
MDKRTGVDPSKEDRSKARPINILLVEDVEDDALLLVRHLRKNGYDPYFERVDTADGLRAVLGKQAWDVVLCDHGMTGFNATAALKIVKEHGLDPPFIVVSGAIGEEKAAEVMRAGVHDLVLKGNLARLVPAIQRELREAEARREKSRADQELDMERRLLQNLMASLPFSIYFKDLQHRYLRLNEAEVRVLKAENAESVVGKMADEFLPADAARMRYEEEKRIFVTGEPLLDRIEDVPQSDGTLRWLTATKAPIRDRDGKIIGLVGVTRDITRRKKAENALRESEAFFRAIVDYAPAAVVIKDLDGRNLVANKVYCSWHGTTPDSIVGKTLDDFLDKETSARVRTQERKVLETKSMVEQERRITYPDGITRDVLVQKFPILGSEGEPIAIGTVIIDITDLKRMEESLRTKTQQLEVVLESMDQGIYAVDSDLTCTVINRRLAYLHDLPPELSSPGVKFENLARFDAEKGRYGPGDVEEHVRHRLELARENQPMRYEFDLRNGRIVEIRSNPLPDGGFVRTVTDITELKKKQEALRDSEERFRAVLNSSPSAVSLKGMDGRYQLVNRTYCSWSNGRTEDIIGKSTFDLFSEQDAMKIHEGDQAVLATGETAKFEGKVKYPDGVVRDVIVHKSPIRSATGEVIAVSTTITDITERKRAEEGLRKYSQAVHQSPSSVIIADTGGAIEYVNDAFSQLTGYAAEEAIGKNPRFLKSGETPHEAFENMWATITSGKAWRGTFHNRRKDGTHYLAGATIFPIATEDGTISHFVGTQQDITERVVEQNLLKQAEKMESLGNLAGGIAHDFNNMLLPIIALTKMTIEQLPEASKHRQRLAKVVQAANRAKNLIAKILTFSRQEQLKQEPIDVGDIIDETLGLLRTTLPATVTIQERRFVDSAKVFADATQIGTVLMNLAINAADAMDGRPGKLQISLMRAEIGVDDLEAPNNATPGAYAIIRVKDTGRGMDQDTLRRVFEPFFTTKEVGKGTGLGLATVYGIVTKHGGVIDVSSEVGKGTTFDIYLPLMDERHGGVGVGKEDYLQSAD